MTTVALVPARGGSKGIPGKNGKDFCGKPLLAWAVEIGLATCDYTYISTDDPGLAKMGHDAGAGIILRPEALAEDDTPMLAVVEHALSEVEADILVLLQPTQPLRRRAHVEAAVELLEASGADSVASVVEVPAHYSPDYVVKMDSEGKLEAFLRWLEAQPKRRQDCRRAYSRDGTVYAMYRGTVEAGSLYGDECRGLVIPAEESVNIDTELDWQRAEYQRKTDA